MWLSPNNISRYGIDKSEKDDSNKISSTLNYGERKIAEQDAKIITELWKRGYRQAKCLTLFNNLYPSGQIHKLDALVGLRLYAKTDYY